MRKSIKHNGTVVKGNSLMPHPWHVQGQAGRGFEQPGVVEDVPARGRGLELDDLKGPFQPKPFYDSLGANALNVSLLPPAPSCIYLSSPLPPFSTLLCFPVFFSSVCGKRHNLKAHAPG